MELKKWADIRAMKLGPEELRQIDRQIETELLEALGGTLEICAVVNGKRIKLAEV